MKKLALGFAVMLGTLLVGLAIGAGVYFALAALTGNTDLSQSIGVGVWWLSAIVLFAYANAWLDPFGRQAAAARQRQPGAKAQTAEIRAAALFAMIGGLMMRSQSAVVIVAVAVMFGLAGWFFGADYKRRMNRPPDRQGESPDAKSSRRSHAKR